MTDRGPVSAERRSGWFARGYERRGRKVEGTERIGRIRTRVAGGARGRVLEIGAGTGFNFPYYPKDAEIVAIEPDQEMRRLAEPRARQHGIHLQAGPAERLPFGDGEFDAVISTGVFCSVDDPDAAMTEVHRVLRAGGELRFSEHVLGTSAARRAMQRTLDWLHHRLFRCHIGRDTLRRMRENGFEITELEHPRHADALGVARKR
jgi:ubiquinone/menaquinone biosynthesis C-methylase UbiE